LQHEIPASRRLSEHTAAFEFCEVNLRLQRGALVEEPLRELEHQGAPVSLA
jgi:hypothetical protein